ncbi:MAG: lipid-A-disaccharide synthase [Hyphomicrobium sp.]|nr:lipid-A-disaccharide synthase [Hyphomicrobium sp.]
MPPEISERKAGHTTSRQPHRPLNVFIVAGEQSGDALGGALMAALTSRLGGDGATFTGVGGADMARAGLASIFPIDDVAVMGLMSILPALPRLVGRVYQAVDAAIALRPDIVIIIDSPEFTHPIAKRIRRRMPGVPIVNYVSPSVWAWRPGRAKRMHGYVDHVLALLPFEPAAHARLGGPACTYVGHPLIERLDQIATADGAALARRLRLPEDRPVLLVLPGSRRSEITHLIDVFGDAVARLAEQGHAFSVVIPAVPHVKAMIMERTAAWRVKPMIVDGADKYAAMDLARAALAASGTVTLELALAGTPTVVAYKVDWIMKPLRYLLNVQSVVLANLVLGRNVYPELLQDACTAQTLSAALKPLLHESAERSAQLAALAIMPARMRIASGHPSFAAADVVIGVLRDHADGKSRRAGPT